MVESEELTRRTQMDHETETGAEAPNLETQVDQTVAENAGVGSATPAQQPKQIQIPTNAIGKIRTEERSKGRQTALAELANQAQSMGFSSIEEMMSYAQAAKSTPSEEPQEAPKKASARPATTRVKETVSGSQISPRQLRRLENERAKLLAEQQRLNRARAHEERKRRRAEEQLEAQAAEHQLRLEASKHGIKDVDYALHLIQREINNMDDESLESFDEGKFFSENLRKSHPYLYGTVDRPADTSVQSNPAPQAQMNPESIGTDSDGNNVDARTMDREAFDELLRKRGLTPPTAGMPL